MEEVKLRTVEQMAPGETGIISSISDAGLSVKLMEMGFLPGVTVRYQFAAPLGDPICVSVLNCDLALRRDEARHIHILGQ